MPATNGDDALVPPSTPQCPFSYTAGPVSGSPSVETSTISRPLQPTFGIHLAALLPVEHQLVEPPQYRSLQPRLFDERVSEVLPTMTMPKSFTVTLPGCFFESADVSVLWLSYLFAAIYELGTVLTVLSKLPALFCRNTEILVCFQLS